MSICCYHNGLTVSRSSETTDVDPLVLISLRDMGQTILFGLLHLSLVIIVIVFNLLPPGCVLFPCYFFLLLFFCILKCLFFNVPEAFLKASSMILCETRLQ